MIIKILVLLPHQCHLQCCLLFLWKSLANPNPEAVCFFLDWFHFDELRKTYSAWITPLWIRWTCHYRKDWAHEQNGKCALPCVWSFSKFYRHINLFEWKMMLRNLPCAMPTTIPQLWADQETCVTTWIMFSVSRSTTPEKARLSNLGNFWTHCSLKFLCMR